MQGQLAWEGRCEGSRRQGLLPDPVTKLRCECLGGTDRAAFSISDEWRPAIGRLEIRDLTLQLLLLEAPGFEVRLSGPAPAFLVRSEDEALVAAIETLPPGRSWQHPLLPAEAREPLACLTAGLLLVQPP